MEIERIYALSMRKIEKKDLTNDEIKFMSSIFNMVIESEDYNSTVNYLAGIHGLSVNDIKLIVGSYFIRLATPMEKKQYMLVKNKNSNNSKSRGFATISIISSILILLMTFGIYVAYIIYNLM